MEFFFYRLGRGDIRTHLQGRECATVREQSLITVLSTSYRHSYRASKTLLLLLSIQWLTQRISSPYCFAPFPLPPSPLSFAGRVEMAGWVYRLGKTRTKSRWHDLKETAHAPSRMHLLTHFWYISNSLKPPPPWYHSPMNFAPPPPTSNNHSFPLLLFSFHALTVVLNLVLREWVF